MMLCPGEVIGPDVGDPVMVDLEPAPQDVQFRISPDKEERQLEVLVDASSCVRVWADGTGFGLLRRGSLALGDTGNRKCLLNCGRAVILHHWRFPFTISLDARWRTGLSVWLAECPHEGGFESALFRLFRFAGWCPRLRWL